MAKAPAIPPRSRGVAGPPRVDPAEPAKRIAASAVRAELVAAVDDWGRYETDGVRRARLLEAAGVRTPTPGPTASAILRSGTIGRPSATLPRRQSRTCPAPRSSCG